MSAQLLFSRCCHCKCIVLSRTSVLVSQGIILAWYGKANAARGLGVDADVAAAVRAAVKPFIEWLQNAESEGDESESDDEYGPDLDED